jgi:hypothetical protein
MHWRYFAALRIQQQGLDENQELAADTKQRSPIDPWYRFGGGRSCPSAESQRCLVQLKPDPLGDCGAFLPTRVNWSTISS